MKEDILNLTHSRYAVPLLDGLFDQPICSTSAKAKNCFDKNKKFFTSDPSRTTTLFSTT